jgi:hypothetical protein
MASLQDWELVFTCPACHREGRVAALAMSSVLRCPHCRKTVVIEKEGMKQGSKRPTPSPDQMEEHDDWVSQVPGRAIHPGLQLALAVMVLTAVAAAWMQLLSPPGPAQRADPETQELRRAAEAFQAAWLDGDFDAARAYILSADQPRFESWSKPRRAALVAGFGANFDGRVTAVEVTRKEADQATVRVCFQIRGREQQVFHCWQRTDGNWLLTFDTL